MADDAPPEDLVAARRAFLAADAELARLAAAAPSSLKDGVVVGADPQFAALMEAQRETMRQRAEFIAGHEWMTSAGTWYSSWLRVDRAAKSET